MQNIPVFSIVAYSGTGKTTFIEKLIPKLKSKNFRVAVIKHDAHEFEIDQEGKDSFRITKAGADITVLASKAKSVRMENRPLPLNKLIEQIKDVDIILTEGYKQGIYPKILLHRKETGKSLPLNPDHCFAVVSNESLDTIAPIFDLMDIQGIAELIIRTVGNMDH